MVTFGAPPKKFRECGRKMLVIFPRFRSEMSLPESKKFSTWEKIEALRFIDTLPKKPAGKAYSERELAALVTEKLRRYVSKTSIRNWKKSKDDLKFIWPR